MTWRIVTAAFWWASLALGVAFWWAAASLTLDAVQAIFAAVEALP